MKQNGMIVRSLLTFFGLAALAIVTPAVIAVFVSVLQR
jgi:hypothetical protein